VLSVRRTPALSFLSRSGCVWFRNEFEQSLELRRRQESLRPPRALVRRQLQAFHGQVQRAADDCEAISKQKTRLGPKWGSPARTISVPGRARDPLNGPVQRTEPNGRLISTYGQRRCSGAMTKCCPFGNSEPPRCSEFCMELQKFGFSCMNRAKPRYQANQRVGFLVQLGRRRF
jgi:hypothetical protein